MWNIKPIINQVVDIIIDNKGEILDRRLEELLKKEFSFINPVMLEELFMKMESMNLISVFRVSKTKKMIVLNKNNNLLKKEIMKDII